MKRHYCSYCRKKRYEKNMVLVTYHLLLKNAWHCKEHIDNVLIATTNDNDGNKKSYKIKLSTPVDN